MFLHYCYQIVVYYSQKLRVKFTWEEASKLFAPRMAVQIGANFDDTYEIDSN